MVVKDMLPEVSKEFPDIAVDAYCEEGAWSVDACVKFFEKARKHHPIRVHADQFNSLGMIPEAVRMHARSVDHLEASTKKDLIALAQSPTLGVILPLHRPAHRPALHAVAPVHRTRRRARPGHELQPRHLAEPLDPAGHRARRPLLPA
jgi:imidazolonepropionase-like amidohydrolase